VRLGTCIALELAAAAGIAAGAYLGVERGFAFSRDYFSSHAAAAVTHAPAPELARLPSAQLRVDLPALPTTVFDGPDDVLLAPIGETPVVIKAKINHGGTSLSLRLDFASGARAAFKPEQIHPQSDPRREIAAYRIDRLLGIGHVPPARPIVVPVDAVLAGIDPEFSAYATARVMQEAIAHDGMLRGEASWWIPEIRDALIGGVAIDTPEGMATWSAYLQPGAAIPDDVRPLVAQIATCIVFDVLIDNADRWSGNNTKASVDRKTLYFMDNTLSFSLFTLGHAMNLTPLHRISVFPRSLIQRLRGLTRPMVAAALDLGEDATGLSPLLAPTEIEAIMSRRDHILAYVDELIAQSGEAAVLALP